MKIVYYKVKKDKGEITVTFWALDRPKEVREEQFVTASEDRLRFRFKQALKITEPFEIMELTKLD